MPMDRAEQIGLGTALGGHALLLGAFALGIFLSADQIIKPKPIQVSLLSETAEVATAPQPAAEEEAPAPAPAKSDAPEPDPAPAMQIERPAPRPEPKPIPVPQPKLAEKPLPKPVVKPKPVPKPTPKPLPKQAAATQTKPKPTTQPKPTTKSGGFSKGFEDTIGKVGSAPKTKTGTSPKPTTGSAPTPAVAATKSASQIRSTASATIGAEVRPLIPGCAPSTSDNSSLRVFVSLDINQSARLVSANVYDVQGITPENEGQVAGMKKCVLDSLRAASPYDLNPDDFEVWRAHKVQLKVNFK
jgi:periplasmic protein TonB